MGSTNKTSNLKLNSWIGSDKPQRVDFNYDNNILDEGYPVIMKIRLFI